MDEKRVGQILWYLILSLAIAGLICACGPSREEQEEQAEKERREHMTEALAPICEGDAVSEVAAYNQASGTHPVVVLRGKQGGSWYIDTDYTRTDWEPQALQEVELVACLQNEAALIETCPYKLENGKTVAVERYQYVTNVVLYEAGTGEVLSEMAWTGTEPDRCSAQTKFEVGETVKKVYGVAVGGREVGDWLQPYVELP